MKALINNVCKIINYANEQMNDLVNESFSTIIDGDAFNCIQFGYDTKTGAYIEHKQPFYGSAFTRLYADHKDISGGLHGHTDHDAPYDAERVPRYEEHMMRVAILKFDTIKQSILDAIERENLISNFEI